MTEQLPTTPSSAAPFAAGADLEDAAPVPAVRRGAVPHPVRRVAEWVFFATISWLAWFWVGAVVVWAGIVTVVSRNGDLDQSIWDFAGLGWTRWVLFVAGVVLATQTLPVLVAQGLTRRHVGRGALAGLTVVAAIGALVVAVVHLGETLVYDWNDAVPSFEGNHLFDAGDQFVLVLLESLLVYLSYALSGLFVGTGYYRFGGWLGTLWLPVGLVPIGVVEYLISGAVLPDGIEAFEHGLPLGLAVLVCLAVLALGVVATEQLQRRMELRSRPR